MEVFTWDESVDGTLSKQKMKQKFESLGYSCNVYTYPPGMNFPDHTHNVEKLDGILTGRFKVSMLGDEAILEPGQWVKVPKGAVHAAEVVGNEEVLSIDAEKN